MTTYESLVSTMTTAALVHLIETRGTVSPEHKGIIGAELDRRGVSYNRPWPVPVPCPHNEVAFNAESTWCETCGQVL